MKLPIFNILFSGLLLSACGAPSTPLPELPKEATKMAFTYKTESFQRGLRSNINGIPGYRPHAIINVTYRLQCLSGGKPSAKSRFTAATKILRKAYNVAPIFYDNPREPTQWKSNTSRHIVEQTGCHVTGLTKTVKTTEPRAVMRWAILNKVPPR